VQDEVLMDGVRHRTVTRAHFDLRDIISAVYAAWGLLKGNQFNGDRIRGNAEPTSASLPQDHGGCGALQSIASTCQQRTLFVAKLLTFPREG
jgi:hypothetical protein